MAQFRRRNPLGQGITYLSMDAALQPGPQGDPELNKPTGLIVQRTHFMDWLARDSKLAQIFGYCRAK